ncbi:hypothetical protein [Nitrosopumilus sp.]|uniref:hypothetical protein n=1 Tax=Nitrosopumilus sp. TaxID=2024843 RepID=UPI0034A04BF3
MISLIKKYNSVNSLKTSLEREIEDTETIIQDYSNLLGEKIRTNEEFSADDPDFLALKAKLDGSQSGKKSLETIHGDKKSTETTLDDEEAETTPDNEESKIKKIKEKSQDIKKKAERKRKGKGVSDKWYDLNEIHIYNGIGLKGELELYFKAIDELKTNLENLQRCLATLKTVIEKGLKEDMVCIVFRGSDGVLEIAFLKSSGMRQNFSLKSIYTGPAIHVENMIKIGV